MRTMRRAWLVMRRTGAVKLFISFVIFFCAAAGVLLAAEPDVKSYSDAMWYCFAATTTIGFGDIAAVTAVGRIVTIILSIYGILVTAMITGVIVSYYTEYLRLKGDDTISIFLEKLERLHELPREELEELSEKIKNFNKK